MKKLFSLFLLVLAFSSFTADKKFPSANLKTLDGQVVNVKDFIGNGKPTIVSFWASWCSPCKRELDAFTELYPDWSTKYNVNFVAITVDDSRGLAKVPGIVKSKAWPFTVLADTNQELQQALSFQTIPETLLVDAEGNIVYEHNGYNAGDEFELEAKLKLLTGK
jgi:cytochrome c biogenesis protein CcmG, thiol:disulfide interchange protein DsbE